MKHPRLQFTIGQLVRLVAIAAFTCFMIREGFWLVVAVSVGVAPGFVLDRAWGGSGILGSALAGLLGFGAFGVASFFYQHLVTGVPGPDPSFGTVVTNMAGLGLLSGTLYGVCAWIVYALGGLIRRLRTPRPTRPEPDGVEPPRPSVRFGPPGDRGLAHPRAEGGRT